MICQDTNKQASIDSLLLECTIKIILLQIQSFLAEPEARRAEVQREGSMNISKFLENFYQKKNTGQ